MPPQGKHVPSFSVSVSSFYTDHVDDHSPGHNEANNFRRQTSAAWKTRGSWRERWRELVATMSCIVTSSRISSAHNTKQNKCPLLIKPHNKCRPFVFPFILSTQGETRSEDFRTARRIKRGCCSFCSCFSHCCSCYFSCFGCC